MQSDTTLSGVASGRGVHAVPLATLNAQRGDIIARLERLPFSRVHLRLAAILSIGTFFDAFDAICIAVALTVIFTTLHIGFFDAGLVFSSAYVGQFVGAWGFGLLSEKYGRKNAFIWALLLYGVLSMATALAWNLKAGRDSRGPRSRPGRRDPRRGRVDQRDAAQPQNAARSA